MSKRYASPEESFLARTEPLVGDPGCIIWTGALNEKGYGLLRAGGRMVRAHRYAWERVNGPISDGLELDHACRERSCVNVDHLRLATRAQNLQYRSATTDRNLPRGVYHSGDRYVAKLRANGRQIHVGSFPTIERAEAAVKNARAFWHGVFASN